MEFIWTMGKQIGYVAGTIVIAVVGFAVATPWLYGKRFSDHFKVSVETLKKAEGVQVIDAKIDRRWFSSEAKLSLEIVNQSFLEPVLLSLDFDVSHGPFVKLPGEGWHTAGAAIALDDFSINGRPFAIEGKALVKRSHIEWNFDIPAIRENDFEISKSTVQMMSEKDLSKIKLSIDVPQSSWSKHSNYLTMQGFQAALHLPLDHPNWDLFSNIHTRIEHLSLNGDEMKLEDLNFTVVNEPQVDESLIESNLDFSLEQLYLGEEKSGPLSFVLSSRNNPVSFWREMERRAEQFSDADQVSSLLSTKNPTIGKFLQANPELRLSEFVYKIPEGTLKIGSTIVFGGERVNAGTGIFTDAMNVDAQIVAPRQLIYQLVKAQETEKLTASVALQEIVLPMDQFDMEVEKATTASLYQMEFNKMLMREGDDDYRIQLSVLNGVVSLNGNPSFSLPTMQ
jgi:hypothetical protein